MVTSLSLDDIVVEGDERAVELLVHVLANDLLVIDPAEARDFLDFPLQERHRGPPLELLDGIEDVIAERPADAFDKIAHLLYSVELVVDIEVEVQVAEQFVVLRGETLLEVRHKVRIHQVLANVVVSLDNKLAKADFGRILLLFIMNKDGSELVCSLILVLGKEIVVDEVGI